MSETLKLDAEVRQDKGKGASRRLRHANKIPAVMYGGGEDPVSLTMDHDKVAHALESEAFYSSILVINVDGKEQKAILRDLQRHPSKPKLVHADFQRVSAKESITMQVPLHFINEDIAVGVKIGGGLVSHNMNELEIMCKASDLPEYIEVDIENLEEGESLHISDLKLPAGVESVALSHGEEHDLPVVSIYARRGGEEEAEEEAAAAEAEAPEAEGGEESSED